MGLVRAGTGGADFLESPPVAGKRCFQVGDFLPPFDGDIDVSGLVFDPVTRAPDFLGRQNGRARATELVEHRVTACGAVQKCVGDQRDGLDGRMGCERLHAVPAEGIDARIGPNIGAIATKTAQLDIVSVRLTADPEDADKFVLGTVQRPLPGIGLVPDHQVQHGIIKLGTHCDQIANAPPVHADELNRPGQRNTGAVAKRHSEKFTKLRLGHFAGGEGEVWMLDASASADFTHVPIVRGVAKNRRDRCSL